MFVGVKRGFGVLGSVVRCCAGGVGVERVTLYVVDNTRILGNTIVVKHSL